MKIACNYYLETEELFDEGRIHLDYFKYPALGFQMEIMKDLDAFEGLCSRIAQKDRFFCMAFILHRMICLLPHLRKTLMIELQTGLLKQQNPGLVFSSCIVKKT